MVACPICAAEDVPAAQRAEHLAACLGKTAGLVRPAQLPVAAAAAAPPPSSPRAPFALQHVRGDLFSSAADGLAHCVSADFRMGRGIARLFRDRFGGEAELRAGGTAVGGVAVRKARGKTVFYLVTKKVYSDKPSKEDFRQSLVALRKAAEDVGLASLALPRIGCGLDKLSWPWVQAQLEDVFASSAMSVTVYSLE